MNDWTYHISLVIPQGDTAQILLLPEGDSWVLPRVTVDSLYTRLFKVTRAVKAELGVEITLLREVVQHEDQATKMVQSALLVEKRTLNWMIPEGGKWVDRAELDGLALGDEWMRPALAHTLDTLMDAPPPERPDWFKAGWFDEAAGWMTRVLKARGYDLLGEPEPFKHGAISSLLWVNTTGGAIYFKVALRLPLFGNEPQLSAALGRLFPQYIPAPLVIDAERRWMLTADFGTVLRGSNPTIDLLEKVVRTFARLQIQTENYLDTLFEAGCLDRRLEVLMGQLDGLLADEASYRLLNDEEQAAWRASGEVLKAVCQKLAGYGLPYTLVHGDFHAGNVAVDGERVAYFDWTDACVAHPFLDVIVMIDYDAPEHADVLREAYLDEWTGYAPIDRLREAYEIAKIVGALHQAVSYQGIVNGMESDQRPAWEWGVPRFARDILRQMKGVS